MKIQLVLLLFARPPRKLWHGDDPRVSIGHYGNEYIVHLVSDVMLPDEFDDPIDVNILREPKAHHVGARIVQLLVDFCERRPFYDFPRLPV